MSGVQFNLLPDVKLDYVKTQRSRKVVTTLAILITGVALIILLIMLFTVEVVQKKQLNDAASAVTTSEKQLSQISGLNQILTVQNQLKTLSSLHQQKHISSRLMAYLPEITPVNVQISSVQIDLSQNTITISGSASSQLAINTFVDTLKFAQFQTDTSSTGQPAFSSVVESSFSLTGTSVTYTITANFDPALFANSTTTPKITTNNQVTTRSVLDDPNSLLFTGQSDSKSGGQ